MNLLFCLALIITPAKAVAVCGDCDGDGQVTVDEIVRTITNALGTAPPSTEPPRCSTLEPGDHIDAFGFDYVIIESLVTVEGSPRKYALRQPVRIKSDGALDFVLTRHHLGPECVGHTFSCNTTRSRICGFEAGEHISSGITTSSYGELQFQNQRSISFTEYVGAIGRLTIIIDPAAEPLHLSLSFSTKREIDDLDLRPVSELGYSFIGSQYTNPADLSPLWRADMKKLVDTISIHELD